MPVVQATAASQPGKTVPVVYIPAGREMMDKQNVPRAPPKKKKLQEVAITTMTNN